jgi:CubicO group peptidase (beta-lactamase class C family)
MKPIGVFIIAQLCAQAIFAQTSTTSEQTLAFDRVIKERYKDTAPGGVALIARQGKVIYEKAFGMANLELHVPMPTSAVFQIASMTKQFTAVCILQLMEEGKLSLQDKLTKYISDSSSNGQKITIEQLLTHTSGIVDHPSLGNLPDNGKEDTIPVNLAQSLLAYPLSFEPGTR